jgi:uncharacterized membrane protein (DUF4010 family)
VATVLLLAVVAATVSRDGLHLLGPSLIAGLIAAIGAAGASLRHRSGKAADAVPRGRAFNLLYAIGFAVSLSALTAAMAYMTTRFGESAVIMGAALAGFFDVHAAAASALSVAATTTSLPPAELMMGVLLAVTTNTASKLVAAVSAGGLAYGVRVAAGLIVVVLAMWVPFLWLRF